METPHGLGKLLAILDRFSGRLQILIGIVALGVASAIFTVSGKGRDDQNRNMPLQVVPMFFAAIGLLFFMSQPSTRTHRLPGGSLSAPVRDNKYHS